MRAYRNDTIFAELIPKEEYKIGDISLEMGEAYKHFMPVAKCVAVGPAHDQVAGISEGDWLLFPFHNVTSLINRSDYVIRKTGEGKHVLCCSTHIVQAVISEEAKEEIMADKKTIDWENKATPIGRKVFIKLDNQKEVTDSGIKIPDIAKRPVKTGVIISMGASAHDYFYEEQLSVGDRVLIPEQRSGGELPYQDFKQGLTIRTNPQEIICHHKDGEWRPVGGRLMVEPIIPEYQKDTIRNKSSVTGKEDGIELDVFRIMGSKIIAPGNLNIVPSIGKVIAKGCGWSSKFSSAAAEGNDGPINVEVGDSILLRPTYNNKGEIVFGNEHVTIGSKRMILLQVNFIDAIINDEEFLTGYHEEAQPKADLYRGLGKVYDH